MKALSPRNAFISTLVFWLVIIAGMLTYYQLPLIYGQEVIVDVEPVDPRDFFRGDYVILGYNFSNVEADTYLGGENEDIPEQARVYTQLKRDGEIYIFESFSQEPVSAPDIVNIKGVARESWEDNYRIEYGVESFFVPEGKGRTIERLRNEDRLKAVLMVDSFGRAAIKELLLDNEPLDMDAVEFEVDEELETGEERTREQLTNRAAINYLEPADVINFSYGDSWVYDEDKQVLSHRDATASIRFEVNEEKTFRASFDCDANDSAELSCGTKQLGWQSFQHRETIGEEGHTDAYRKSITRDELQRNYIITANIQPDDEELWEEVEAILSTIWVKDI